MYRSHTCGELRATHIGQTVTLAGWVQKSRDFGGMTFLDVRDRYGITQLVFNESTDKAVLAKVEELGREFVIQATGEVIELRCTYDPATRGGNAPDGRKVKGTIHWVAAATAVRAEVRLYDRLFNVPDPGVEEDFLRHINPASKEVLGNCVVEPSLAAAAPEARFQFERLGYFCADRHDHSAAKPVFNRTVTLRDTWAKISGR